MAHRPFPFKDEVSEIFNLIDVNIDGMNGRVSVNTESLRSVLSLYDMMTIEWYEFFNTLTRLVYASDKESLAILETKEERKKKDDEALERLRKAMKGK